MSLSSKSRKESTESYAAQGMRSTMGIPPELAQLNDKNLENDLPSRVADSNDTDVPGDYEQAKTEAAVNDDGEQEAALADDSSTDEDNPGVAYQSLADSPSGEIAAADWNRSTSEGSVPATRANEPDRTLGNS